ncbi:MAG: hypothetical protein ACI3ZQ_11350 [Candidatus Cryptobacteroides sp.]
MEKEYLSPELELVCLLSEEGQLLCSSVGSEQLDDFTLIDETW